MSSVCSHHIINLSKMNIFLQRLVPVSEAPDSSTASPVVTKRDTPSLHSVDSNPSDEVELEDVEEEDPQEFQLKGKLVWIDNDLNTR